MELSELKMVFDAGGLTSAVVSNAVMSRGFILIFNDKNKNAIAMTSQRDESPRVFKTIDAAVRNAEKVGFMKIVVDLK